MTGFLLPCSVFRATDSAGVPLSGALLQFYETGTTTPTPVYTDATLGTPLSNPVVSDSAGLFVPIFYDPAVTYRMVLKTSANVVIQNVDPVIAPHVPADGSITSSMLVADAVVTNLGYTPLNQTGDTATDLRVNFGATLFADNAGYLGLPVVVHNAADTFALTDSGHLSLANSGLSYAWTIPPFADVAFPLGTVIACRNFNLGGSGVITLTRGAGVFLRLAGSATSQDVSLAVWAMGAITNEAQDNWIWTGTGGS